MPADIVDRASAVREGEDLDRHRLHAYLREHLDAGDAAIELEQFPGGHSNLTYLVRAGEREWVLRRPPFGSRVKSAHDMGREYRMLSRLSPVYDKAPAAALFCEDESIIGAKFYLMERVRGVIIRKRPPRGLDVTPELARGMCGSLVDTLAELHAIDYRAIGLDGFGKPEGYVRRQVEGWTQRYYGSQTDDVPQVERVATWLAEHMPPETDAAIIHNDFKFDNVVLAPDDLTRVVGILDWEMTTVGDPLMDLGTSLSYWVEADDSDAIKMIGFGPTMLPGMYTRRELADRYADNTGRDVSNVLFYYCYGLFKTAVVVQQIYYRYKQGLTHDERFAQFGLAMKLLVDTAAGAIDADCI